MVFPACAECSPKAQDPSSSGSRVFCGDGKYGEQAGLFPPEPVPVSSSIKGVAHQRLSHIGRLPETGKGKLRWKVKTGQTK